MIYELNVFGESLFVCFLLLFLQNTKPWNLLHITQTDEFLKVIKEFVKVIKLSRIVSAFSFSRIAAVVNEDKTSPTTNID